MTVHSFAHIVQNPPTKGGARFSFLESLLCITPAIARPLVFGQSFGLLPFGLFLFQGSLGFRLTFALFG